MFISAMKKSTVVILGAFVVWAVLCGPTPAPVQEEPPWFGQSESDFARAEKFLGLAVKVKARFVKLLGVPGSRHRSRRTLTFLVAAAAGEIVCEINPRSRRAALLTHMKRATPLVLYGTIDSDTYVFHVKKLLQGWERKNVEGTGKR